MNIRLARKLDSLLPWIAGVVAFVVFALVCLLISLLITKIF